jgi:hypothetical protein
MSSRRRITVEDYKGKTLVALREFYEKDGKMLPAKSGISLTVEQFTALLLALPDVLGELQSKGFECPKVTLQAAVAGKDARSEDEDSNDDSEQD